MSTTFTTLMASIWRDYITDAVPSSGKKKPEKAAIRGMGATLDAAFDAKAPLVSPALTGTPTVPTAALGTNTTQAASTAFVNAAIRPAYVAGRYYATFRGTRSTGAGSLAADTLYVYPYPLHRPLTLATLGMFINTAGTTSSVKMGIYANDPATNRPTGAPLAVANTGVATTASLTFVSEAAVATLAPGTIWIAQLHTGTLPVPVAVIQTDPWMAEMIGIASVTAAAQPTSLSVAQTYSSGIPTLTGAESWTTNITVGAGIVYLGA